MVDYKTSKAEIFDSIYRAYYEEVYRTAIHYTKDEHNAKDMTQKAFLRFYKHMNGVKKECIHAYLLRAVRHLCYNFTRDAKYYASDEVLEWEIIESDCEDIRNPEENYIRREEEERVAKFLNSIMERLRAKNESWYYVLNQVYCLHVPVEEVAEELGVSNEVVYSRLYRGKKWVQKNYQKEYEKVLYKSE